MENHNVLLVLETGSMLVFATAIGIIGYSRIKRGLTLLYGYKDKFNIRR